MKYCLWDKMDSVLGELLFVATEEGLCQIDFLKPDKPWDISEQEMIQRLQKQIGEIRWEHQRQELQPYLLQVDQYLRRKRIVFDLPLVFEGTSFQKKVWHQLRQIPYGEVRSYKEVAIAIGSPQAVRAIGGANNCNPLPLIVPCHRVIGANRALVGYGGGLQIKQQLLELEGIHVAKQMVI